MPSVTSWSRTRCIRCGSVFVRAASSGRCIGAGAVDFRERDHPVNRQHVLHPCDKLCQLRQGVLVESGVFTGDCPRDTLGPAFKIESFKVGDIARQFVPLLGAGYGSESMPIIVARPR